MSSTPTLVPAPHPWDQRPEETQPAYEAFLAYRDMPPDQRSIRGVAKDVLGKSDTLIGRWSSKHGWQARVASWDADVTRRNQHTRIRQQDRAVSNHLSAATTLLAQALARLRPTPIRDRSGEILYQQNGDPYLEPADAAELTAATNAMDKAIKHQRLALGLPTDVTRQDVVLREQVKEAADLQAEVLRLVETVLCGDCRSTVLPMLLELRDRVAAVRAGVGL